MKSKIFLYANPEFDRRFSGGISRLYQIFCQEHNYGLEIIDQKFLEASIPGEKHSKILVIAGGDGTIHRVINSLPEESLGNFIFGIIPGGTANEFAKSIKLPLDIENSAQVIANFCKHNIKRQNIGIVNSRYRFLTGLLFGIAREVLSKTPQKAKMVLGPFAYNFAGLASLINYEKYLKEFSINEKKVSTGYLIINNASLLSKEIPTEDLPGIQEDNFAIIFLKNNLKLKDIVRLSIENQFHKKLLTDPAIKLEQGKKILLEFNGEITLMLDGEVYTFNSPLNISHCKNKIAVIQP